MPRTTRKLLALGLLGLTLTLIPFAGPASAQTTGDRTGTDTGTTTTQADRDDDGFDYGWLGLLGLVGLAGLRPRKDHTVTTHRTGNTSGH